MSKNQPQPIPYRPSLRDLIGLACWIALTFCAPALGFISSPDDWYAGLNKPSWNPPPWIFGPVWTVLYLMMATAAWLVWRRHGWNRAHWFYLLQLSLNAAWTPVFFGLHQPGWAFAIIIAMWLAIWLTARAFARLNRAAAWLLVPYAAWVAFATVLNFTLWRMNP